MNIALFQYGTLALSMLKYGILLAGMLKWEHSLTLYQWSGMQL